MNLGGVGKMNAAYSSVAHCNQVSKNGVQGLSVSHGHAKFHNALTPAL